MLETVFESTEKAQIVFRNSASVTDGGSIVKTVFTERCDCQCHAMNLIVSHLLEDKDIKDEYYNIFETLDSL